jgi:hypothetical protein
LKNRTLLTPQKPWYEKYQAREQGYKGKGNGKLLDKQPTSPHKQTNKNEKTAATTVVREQTSLNRCTPNKQQEQSTWNKT